MSQPQPWATKAPLAGPSAQAAAAALELFHPAVRTWFERRFPHGPTEAQAQGWPAIARGEDTLIAAPTGSGKTLSAFLLCIDRLYRAADAGQLAESGVEVVYVSPLKALVVDIRQTWKSRSSKSPRSRASSGSSRPRFASARAAATRQRRRASRC